MKHQLTILGTQDGPLVAPAVDKVRAVMRAMERVDDPDAKSTIKAYEAARERYGEWCRDFQVEPFPLTPILLISHLEWLTSQPTRFGGTFAPSSVRQAMAALCSMDRWQRTTPENPKPLTIAASPYVQRWLRSWEKENPLAPRKRAPVVTRAQLLRIMDTLEVPPIPSVSWQAKATRVLRDRAIWLVGIGAAMRVSDLSLLSVEDVEEDERGILITFRKRKQDQQGKTQTVGIEHARTLELCPVRAWRGWLAARGTWRGPAFVGVQRSGELSGEQLYTRSIQRILTETAARAEVTVSGHSLRRTLATRAVKNGARRDAIQRHGGWSRADSMQPYFSIEDAWDDNPTAGLFDT